MEKQANTGKIRKTTKGKTGKANYEDDDSREKADCVLAEGGVEKTDTEKTGSGRWAEKWAPRRSAAHSKLEGRV
jgi:hypothetical protein